VVLFFLVRSFRVGRTMMALGAALALTACATADSPRRSADAPTLRCVNEPGRGQSLDASRPLFFLFCAQSP
jgi:hypothetical protein